MDVISGLLGLGALSTVGFTAKDAVAGLRRANERSLSDFLPWGRLIRPNIVTTSQDEYMTVIRFGARDIGTQGSGELFETARRLAATIGAMKPKANIKIHFHAIRQRTSEYLRPSVKPANPVLDDADEERERFFREEEPGWETVRYITLAWRPQDDDLARFRAAVVNNIDEALAIEQELLAQFEALVSRLLASLNDAFDSVHRLGEYAAVDDYGVTRRRSELLEFLHYFMLGKFSPFNVPVDSIIELQGLLSSRGFSGRKEPYPKLGDEYTLPILLKTFPQESEPQILDELTRLGVPHHFSIRYLPLTLSQVHKQTRNIVLDYQAQAQNGGAFVDPGAVDSADEVADAHGAAKGAYTQFGWCIFTIVVRSKTLAGLIEAKNAVITALEKPGFPNAYVPEELPGAAWDAIVSTWPGSPRRVGIHKHLEHALGVSTLLPLHEHNAGRKYSDHPYRVSKTPPHFYAMGRGQALTRVHTSSADVEHLLGLAPSGWGKTSFQSYLGLMRLARLPLSEVAYFDKGLGACRAAMMADGAYYPLLGTNSPGLALFDGSLDDNTIIEILSEMVAFWEPYTFPSADEDKSLRDALRIIMAPNYPLEFRSTSAFVNQIQDMGPGRLQPTLSKYAAEGPLRGMLNASTDSFSTANPWTVFDIERVIELPPKYLVPLLRVLFAKIIASAARRRLALGEQGQYYQLHINLDESHLLQGHPAGRKFILDILKMGRAQNLGLSLWSNGLKEFAESPDRSELLSQCRTRIFGMNAAAGSDNESDQLRSLGVNDRGVKQITQPEPDGARDFLLCQPDEGIQQVLNARLTSPMIAMIGDPRTNHLVEDFKARWPINRFGMHEAKIRLIEHEAERHPDPAQRVKIAAFAARLRAKIDALKAHETPGILIGAS